MPLNGCDSGSSPPPFTLSCFTHRLPGGFIRANVTVTNSTGSTGTAIVYGPPFDGLRHIYPVSLLHPAYVTVIVSHSRQIYTGFAAYPVGAKHPTHLIFRFIPPPHAESLLVTTSRTVHASGWDVLKNANCVIRR